MDISPHEYLIKLGAMRDDDIDPAAAAIMLAADDHAGISLSRFFFQLDKLKQDVAKGYAGLADKRGGHIALAQHETLRYVIHDQEKFDGDRDTYDHLDNMDMIRVMDRRKGVPAAISLLYLSCGLSMGWNVCALNFPGHVLCRVEAEGERIIFDPFHGGKALAAHEIRSLAKNILGERAEISADWFNPVTPRDILIRLLNNIKIRQVKSEDYDGAVKTVEKMRLVAPNEYRVFFDAGVLYARVGQKHKAIDMLETYIAQVPKPSDRADALRLITEIKSTLQ